MVTRLSNAGPSMHKACTSELIDVGREAPASMASATSNANEPMPWPMSNMTPRSRAWWQASRTRPSAVTGAFGRRPEAVGEGVARRSSGQHLLVARRRPVDVAHHRQARLLGGLDREVQRQDAVGAAGVGADPHLDAADQVGILAGHAGADLGLEQAQVPRFADHHLAREAVDAGEADVQVGQDAGLAALDDVVAEALEIAGTGAADVQPGGRPGSGGPAGRRRRPSEAPPQIDVGVEVDHARHDDGAGGRADGGSAFEPGPDRGHLAARERHVGHGIDALAGIDHAAPAQHRS